MEGAKSDEARALASQCDRLSDDRRDVDPAPKFVQPLRAEGQG